MVFPSGAAAAAALFLGTIISTMMFVREREARSSEARLRREAEAREQASQVASLVTQGRFDEADKLASGLPLNKLSVEFSAELRALGDWHAANGRWAEAASWFDSVMKVNQLDAPEIISEERLKLAATFLKSGSRQGLRAVPPDGNSQVKTNLHISGNARRHGSGHPSHVLLQAWRKGACTLGVGRGEKPCSERSQYWLRQVELASVGLRSPHAARG